MIARLSALTLLASVMAVSAVADLSPVEAQDLTPPSGQPVEFYETIMDQPAMGLTARFRFLAPQLSHYLDSLSYEELEADLSYLCDSYALPRLSVPEPAMIVISLTEAPVEFGAPAPDMAQVFEAYHPEDGSCEWEAF